MASQPKESHYRDSGASDLVNGEAADAVYGRFTGKHGFTRVRWQSHSLGFSIFQHFHFKIFAICHHFGAYADQGKRGLNVSSWHIVFA